jgi:hypothetical protein
MIATEREGDRMVQCKKTFGQGKYCKGTQRAQRAEEKRQYSKIT